MKRWNPCTVVLVVVMMLAVAAPVLGFGFGGGGMGGGMMGQAMPKDMWGGADFNPVVGQWAEYLMTSKDEEPVTIRISIVGEEDGAYWYEMQMTGEDEEGFITKMLVSGDPEEQDNLKRLIIKGGDEPAMEMPVGMGMGGSGGGMMGGPGGGMMGGPGGEMMGGEDAEGDETDSVMPSDLGMETVVVPAGTFKAHHWRVEDEDVRFDMWQAESVGPYGTVKSSSEDFEMVLTAYGDDATSAITEEPEKFEMPSFNMQGFGK